LENGHQATEIHILVNGKIINHKDLGFTNGKMANNITANGRMDLNMVLEKTNLKIHKLILDNLELENAME